MELITRQLENAGFTEASVTVVLGQSTAPLARDVAFALAAVSPLAL
jgi:hypothetical protein